MANQRWITAIASVALFGLVACGGDATSDVGTNSADDDSTADAGNGTQDSGDDSSSDDEPNEPGSGSNPEEDAGADAAPTDPAGPEIPDEIEPPDPILPDVDPETLIPDLGEDDFEQVCDAFKDSTTELLDSFSGLCGFSALSDALDEEPETTKEFQELCADNRKACEIETKAAADILSTLECSQSDECTATVGEFDACNAELTTINEGVLIPIGEVDIPPCDELTPRVARAIQLQIVAALVLAGVPLDEDFGAGACDTVSEKCPDFALPGGLPL